jgi:hypothetical protein
MARPRDNATPPATATPPAVVALHLFGVARLPTALRLMASTRTSVRRLPGCTFAKLLGTGTGDSFTLRDADRRHWAALTCWETDAALEAGEAAPPLRAWRAAAYEQARILMRPLRSRGRWSGREPFGAPDRAAAATGAGPVAALTRARIRPAQWRTFWSAVPAVAADAHRGGMLLGLGIGEAPVLLQGTYSIWADAPTLDEFTYRRRPHATAIRRTTETGWYAEELFARFAVTDVSGRYRDRPVVLPPPR